LPELKNRVSDTDCGHGSGHSPVIALLFVEHRAGALQKETSLYSRLRFLNSACLIAFGTVVVAGATGVLPGLIERLSTGADEVSRTCQGEIRLPWGRTCSSQSDAPAVAARLPGSDVNVVDHPDREQVTAVEQPQPIPNTASGATQFMEPRAAVAPAQQFASAPPAIEEAPQAAPTAHPQAAPTAQALPIAPSVKPKPRAAKKVARKEPSSERERERDEALRTVRRAGRNNNAREIPVDAYAAESTLRQIIIRPTSIQDVYYYYGRR
jgi:hypothetical protein